MPPSSKASARRAGMASMSSSKILEALPSREWRLPFIARFLVRLGIIGNFCVASWSPLGRLVRLSKGYFLPSPEDLLLVSSEFLNKGLWGSTRVAQLSLSLSACSAPKWWCLWLLLWLGCLCRLCGCRGLGRNEVLPFDFGVGFPESPNGMGWVEHKQVVCWSLLTRSVTYLGSEVNCVFTLDIQGRRSETFIPNWTLDRVTSYLLEDRKSIHSTWCMWLSKKVTYFWYTFPCRRNGRTDSAHVIS